MHTKNLQETIGFVSAGGKPTERARMLEYLNMKLAARGFETPNVTPDSPMQEFARSLLEDFEEKFRLFGDILCPVDQAIQDFLQRYLGEHLAGVFDEGELMVPARALNLERHGLARELSLPADSDSFSSPILSSYRVKQGVLHNPAKDRRTTEGVFHIVDGGLPIPADKKSVPRGVFARLLRAALQPPEEILELPYSAGMLEKDRIRTFVSLLLRPLVIPGVVGAVDRRSMEVRFFAPGTLVSNLDFVESIFGNAGDPFLPENDSRLDAGGWTGHTGCVILAPHLITLRKKDLGLPHVSRASERQVREGMCYESEDELYNEGGAFKIACRDQSGVMVTLIADSYYGYCKKEVKTQISFSANLHGMGEEEHSGGAMVYPSFDLGEDFDAAPWKGEPTHRWSELRERFADRIDFYDEGYGRDKKYDDIFYVPEKTKFDIRDQSVVWTTDDGALGRLRLLTNHVYVLPSGYWVCMGQPGKGQRWRLIGTQAEGTFCHKPCTVSGGGKSEISKPLAGAMIAGPVFLRDFAEDLKSAEALIQRDYGDRFITPSDPMKPSRSFLDPSRSFGSVVRMLTPSENYTVAYNGWLKSIPRWIRELVLVIKRRYKPEWGGDWVSRFSVDSIDGKQGIELKFQNQKLSTRYLRVGFTPDGSWRTFGLRKDYSPAFKLQMEDDITASVLLPSRLVKGMNANLDAEAYKFSENCEFRLFQRPDDAVIRGADAGAEEDFCAEGTFFSNYQPLPREQAGEMLEDAIRFGQFTDPMKDLVRSVANTTEPEWFVCTAHPRIVDGKPTKNPRYLQNRPDLVDPRSWYLADMATRLQRRLPSREAMMNPVNAVLPGRRNNPAEPEIRPLAVYGPLHYQELPELFMDFIASLTGKSPSTTGAGSEGALTKGPFNALAPVADLNAALLSYILTGLPVFTSAAGHIGRKFRVDHDISLIVPEVWSRMHLKEREPAWLMENSCLEAVEDFEWEGEMIEASLLGWRITQGFCNRFIGRVFSDPEQVIEAEMLRPELQSMGDFVEGIKHIQDGQRKSAEYYFVDGTVELAIPPLKALLHIMMKGSWEGKGRRDPSVRGLFTREAVLRSDWYQQRLDAQLQQERKLWKTQLLSLEKFLQRRGTLRPSERVEMEKKRALATEKLAELRSPDAVERYFGMLGVQPELL